jgi:hypothetical protein
MPGDPRECRQHALRCLELAKSAASPEAKAKFLDLASTWTHLASDLEAMGALIEAEKTEDKRPS